MWSCIDPLVTRPRASRMTGRFASLVAVGGMLVSIGGCEGLLDVKMPGNVTEGDLFIPQSAAMLIDAAIADFECSFSMYTVQIAGMEDARHQTSGYWGAFAFYNSQRPGGGACTTQTPTGISWFDGFQASRFMSETAYERISGWTDAQVPNRQRLLATAAVYAGLYYTLHGEVFCEFSPATGPLLTPKQMLMKGEEWFTTALQHIGTGDFSISSTTSLKQFALLGRARTRFAMGDLAGARADATQIAPGFVGWATRDAAVRGRWNAVYQGMNVERWGSIAPEVRWHGHTEEVVSRGYQYLTVSRVDGRPTVNDGAADPRVPVVRTGQTAQDGVTPQYNQTKYLSLSSPQAIAKYAEAQLILAEIEGGTAAVARINALRTTHNLPHYSAGTSAAEIRDLIIEERRREFFFEGRHFADKLRYNLWFPRGQGRNHKAFAYGFGYCLLMPLAEYQTNPHIARGYEGPDLTNPTYMFSTR
jgi:starch-binding outer membrane protein, SusD/RagB family